MKIYYIKKKRKFYFTLDNVMHSERKIKSNFTFNFGVENEIF